MGFWVVSACGLGLGDVVKRHGALGVGLARRGHFFGRASWL